MLPAYSRVGGSPQNVKLVSLKWGEGCNAKLTSEPMCLGCTGEPLFLLRVSCFSELRSACAPVVKGGINLHCSMQIQGIIRQHQTACGAALTSVVDLTIALHWGKENFLSDYFVGDPLLGGHLVYCE